MKKLKPWQIVLLVIFYPVGIIYLIIWLTKKNGSSPAPTPASAPTPGSKPASSFNPATAQIERDFHTKVVGVSFNNANGTSRQDAIKACRSGESVLLRPSPSKEFPDAIGVFSSKGQQLGFLNAELAADMKYKYPTHPMSCAISDIHGGEDGKNLGVNLHIVIYKK